MEIIQIILSWDKIAYDLIYKGLHNPFLFYLFNFITNAADLVVFALTIYCLIALFSHRDKSKEIFHIISPVFVTAAITVALKLLIQRGPPGNIFVPWAEIPVPLLPMVYAFPSGHASRAFALAAILASKFPTKRFFLFGAAAAIGFSRIYIGVHYPLDVIAGAILGILISWLFIKIKNQPST